MSDLENPLSPSTLTSLIRNWLDTCATKNNSPNHDKFPRDQSVQLLREDFSPINEDQSDVTNSRPDEEQSANQEVETLRDSDSPSSVMKFFPFGLDQNMVCPMCKKCFRFEKNLLRHMQNSHATGTGESVLKCKLCNYTTRHYSNMYVHIRTHTGDKPYSCSACGAAFTQGSSLKLHIKSRHNDNTEYFSLTRKPGKNNLTKLWTRVLKKDLPKFNSNILSTAMMNGESGKNQNHLEENMDKKTIKKCNILKNQKKKDIMNNARKSNPVEIQRPNGPPFALTRPPMPVPNSLQFREFLSNLNIFTEAASIFMNSTNQKMFPLPAERSCDQPGMFYDGYRVPSPTALLNKIRNK